MQDNLRKVTRKPCSVEKQFIVAHSVPLHPFPHEWEAPHEYRCPFSHCLPQMIDHEVELLVVKAHRHTWDVFQDNLQVGGKVSLRKKWSTVSTEK